MKTALLFILILIFSTNPAEAQITSADTMVHRLFAVLKAKNRNRYLALYPNNQQMTRLVAKMIRSLVQEIKNSKAVGDTAKKSQEEDATMDSLLAAELMKKALPEDMHKVKAKYAEAFNQVLTRGEAKGIIWNNIKLTGYNLDTAYANESTAVKFFGSDDLRFMTGTLYFTSDDSAYRITFNKVMFLPEEGGWYGGEFGMPLRMNEAEPEDEYEKTETASEPAAVEPIKPKAKTKTKSSSSKTKAKAKSKP